MALESAAERGVWAPLDVVLGVAVGTDIFVVVGALGLDRVDVIGSGFVAAGVVVSFAAIVST